MLVHGQLAAVGSRAFDLLLALIERRDRVATKAELLDAVWPGLVVEENNLQTQVSTLRRLIGQSAIVTVQGRGYRFTLSPVHALPPAAAFAVAAGSVAPRAPLPQLPLQGRDADIADLARVVRERALVSVVGPGGIGKTALARQVAHWLQPDFGAGVCWADLSGLHDSVALITAVAQAAGLPTAEGEALPPLVAALYQTSALVVLDNAEHLREATAALAAALLAAGGGTHLLVTSQVPLHVDGETVFRLGALAAPPAGCTPSQALGCGSVGLFVQQAQAADRHFTLNDDNTTTVVEICSRLGGLPLAIKLAASRLPVLGLGALLARLDDSLQLLRWPHRQAPTRQQTMEAALDWSHGLLGNRQRLVFRRIAPFVGGFVLGTAVRATDWDEALDEWQVIDALQQLLDHSLLEVDATDSEAPRYRLPECTRQYALLQLARAGETQAQRQGHAMAMLASLEAAYDAYWRTADEPWLRRHELELDNVRQALDWTTEHDPAAAVRLAGAACPLLMLVGLAPEARRRCAALHEQALALGPSPGTERYWLERSRLEWGVSHAQMLRFAGTALVQYRQAGNQLGTYLALRCAAVPTARDDVGAARSMVDEMAGLEQPDWGPRVRTQRLLATAQVLQAAGEFAAAADALRMVLALEGSAGLEAASSAALSGLASVSLQCGDYDAALDIAQRLLARRHLHRGNFVLHALATAGTAWLLKGDDERACSTLVEFAHASCQRNWEWFALYAHVLALMVAQDGRAIEAAQILGFAAAAPGPASLRDAVLAAAGERATALCDAVLPTAQRQAYQELGRTLSAEQACGLVFGLRWQAPGFFRDSSMRLNDIGGSADDQKASE